MFNSNLGGRTYLLATVEPALAAFIMAPLPRTISDPPPLFHLLRLRDYQPGANRSRPGCCERVSLRAKTTREELDRSQSRGDVPAIFFSRRHPTASGGRSAPGLAALCLCNQPPVLWGSSTVG